MSKQLVILAVVATLLGACGVRPGPELLSPVPPPANQTRQVNMVVATNREPDLKAPGNFGEGRSDKLSFARYVISVPPDHKQASIEFSSRRPVDPETSFATLAYEPLPGGLGDLAKAVGGATANATEEIPYNGKVLVFVHGYNTNYAESVLRMAQLVADNPAYGSLPVLFAWPSDGAMPGYVADKDAVTFSRDQLAQVLTDLAEDPRNREITLAAHSMGGWLTMETLRQLRLSGKGAVLNRLDNVLLAAPDIDLDVFRAQAKAVGRLDPPITVLTSPDDKALRFSYRLGGDRERVGGLDVRDPRIEELANAYGVQIIDISGMAATDGLNHDKYIGAAASLKGLLKPKNSESAFRKAGAFVMDAMAAALETPGRIGRAAAMASQ
ncbi:alpha/beta hydrolase [Humidesulfovibrio sp.]